MRACSSGEWTMRSHDLLLVVAAIDGMLILGKVRNEREQLAGGAVQLFDQARRGALQIGLERFLAGEQVEIRERVFLGVEEGFDCVRASSRRSLTQTLNASDTSSSCGSNMPYSARRSCAWCPRRYSSDRSIGAFLDFDADDQIVPALGHPADVRVALVEHGAATHHLQCAPGDRRSAPGWICPRRPQ